MSQSAENDAPPCEVHVPGRDRPSPWCAACRMSAPENACVCPDDYCLGTDSDSGMRVECAACLALDPELPCLRDTEETTPIPPGEE